MRNAPAAGRASQPTGNERTSDMNMRLPMKCLALLLPCAGVFLLGAAQAAEEQVVSQKNKAFSVKKLTIKVGDSVKFVNEDSFAHNVFSLSAAKSFDLGSFGNGGTKTITFDKPGKIEVECAVHPDMRMDIEVKP
jgi:plastocyanin